MWDLRTSRIETVSPPLAGRFCTAEPPGKPCVCSLQIICVQHLSLASSLDLHNLF